MPITKAAYAAEAEEGESAYNVAVADLLNAPDIEEIDLNNYTGKVGDTITIKATDDFKVVEVIVSINNPVCSLVETLFDRPIFSISFPKASSAFLYPSINYQ